MYDRGSSSTVFLLFPLPHGARTMPWTWPKIVLIIGTCSSLLPTLSFLPTLSPPHPLPPSHLLPPLHPLYSRISIIFTFSTFSSLSIFSSLSLSPMYSPSLFLEGGGVIFLGPPDTVDHQILFCVAGLRDLSFPISMASLSSYLLGCQEVRENGFLSSIQYYTPHLGCWSDKTLNGS